MKPANFPQRKLERQQRAAARRLKNPTLPKEDDTPEIVQARAHEKAVHEAILATTDNRRGIRTKKPGAGRPKPAPRNRNM